MNYDDKKALAYEFTKIFIQKDSVNVVTDGYGNIKFEINGDFFSFHELCHYFFIEIDNFEVM